VVVEDLKSVVGEARSHSFRFSRALELEARGAWVDPMEDDDIHLAAAGHKADSFEQAEVAEEHNSTTQAH
jgi:hypothetical protein